MNRIPVEDLLFELPRVRRLARALVGEALADDLAQEAMRVALESRPARPVAAGAWLTGITRNLARSLRRGEARRRRREAAVAVPEGRESADALERSEAVALLGRALAALPAEDRALLVARYLDGVRPAVLAARRGEPAGTTRSSLTRALGRLRRSMQTLGGEGALHGLVGLAALPAGGAGVAVAGKAYMGSGLPAWVPAAAVAAALAGGAWLVGTQPWRTQQPTPPTTAEAPAPATVDAGAQEPRPAPPAVVREVAGYAVELRLPPEQPGAAPQPAAGVRTWWIPEQALGGLRAKAGVLRQGRVPEFLLDPARSAVSGTDGIARFAAPPDAPFLLWAETAGHAGVEGPFEPDGARPRLDLLAVRWLHVEVLDAHGQPAAGVPLTLTSRDSLALFSTGADLVSDAEGFARLPLPDVGAEDADLALDVVATVLGAAPVRGDAGTVAAPQPRVVLRLPPAGRLTVTLPGDGPQDGLLMVMRTGQAQGVGMYPFENGRAGIAWVALGQSLELTGSLGGEAGVREARIDGPRDPGEEVVFELAEDAGTWLVGRLLDADGEPLRLPRTWFREPERPVMVIDGWGIDEQPLELNPDGRFRLGLGLLEPGFETLRLRVRYRDAVAVAPQALVAQPGINELGDLRLGAGPRLVSGLVVADGGGAVAGVKLRVDYGLDDGRDGLRWVLDPVLDVTSAADGSFRIDSVPRETPWRLRVEDTTWVQQQPLRFRAGESAAMVRVGRAGSLTVRWLAPEELPSGALRVRLLAADEPEPAQVAWRMRDGDRCDWQGVQPGEYRIEFALEGGMQPLLVLDGLRVDAGGACSDARLDGIDLRSVIRIARLRVHGVPEEDLGELPVCFSADVFARPVPLRRDGGELLLAWGEGTGDQVAIGDPAHGWAAAELLDGIVSVRLQASRTTRFLLDGGPAEAEFQYRLGVRPAEEHPLAATLREDGRPRAFDGDGEVYFTLPPLDAVRLEWQLFRRDGEDWRYLRRAFVTLPFANEARLPVVPPPALRDGR